MKQIVFNVGGALSTYMEFAGRKVLIDVGSSDDFNPVKDFLLPLFTKRNGTRKNGKFLLDQCIISHPHKDHISAIDFLNEYFHFELLTCPNDNNDMPNDDKINWELVGNSDDPSIVVLKKMLEGRNPPLRSSDTTSLFIYYLHPKDVEKDTALRNESYVNNISIVTLVRSGGYAILCPGDLQKIGMERLIKKSSAFRRHLSDGIDVLITPHHGLKSSFSVEMFEKMKNGKSRCLNVVPEKVKSDDNREVDSRYSTNDYCAGENSLSTNDEKHYQVKTSRGHVLLNYKAGGVVDVKIIGENDDLLKEWEQLP